MIQEYMKKTAPSDDVPSEYLRVQKPEEQQGQTPSDRSDWKILPVAWLR